MKKKQEYQEDFPNSPWEQEIEKQRENDPDHKNTTSWTSQEKLLKIAKRIFSITIVGIQERQTLRKRNPTTPFSETLHLSATASDVAEHNIHKRKH